MSSRFRGAPVGNRVVPTMAMLGRWLISATCITVLVAVVTIAVTNRLDDQRSRREAKAEDRRIAAAAKASESADWREQLRSNAVLPGAHLAGLELTGVYASDVDLSGASAKGVDLGEANLIGVRFDGADLRGASFRRATLKSASFNGADLRGADLSEANLRGVDLRFADLHRADLTGSAVTELDVRGVDLSHTQLSASFERMVCWDEHTTWPDDFATPLSQICSDAPHRPAQTERWSVAAYTAEVAHPYLWSHRANIGDARRFVIEVEFVNLGKTVLQDVSFQVRQQGDGIPVRPVPGSIQMLNDNFPDGYQVSDDAIQEEGGLVNVNVGNYGGNGGAYLLVEYEVGPEVPCGPHAVEVQVWASAAERGAVTDSAIVDLLGPAC